MVVGEEEVVEVVGSEVVGVFLNVVRDGYGTVE